MPLLTQERTNWKYILIIVILALLVGGGSFWYVLKPELPGIKKLEKIEKAIVENNLIFKPNFDGIENIIEDDNVIWALTPGGILKYNQKNNEIKIYSVKNGLTGESSYRNMVKRGDYIWVATDYGISRLDIRSEKTINYHKKNSNKKDSWRDTFEIIKFNTLDGLASNSNLYLYLDPFTDELWTESFQGISKFQDDKEEWISYGVTADGQVIFDSDKITFNKDFIITFSGSNAYSSGGIYAFDRNKKEWFTLSKKEEYNLQNGDVAIIANEDTLWAEGRPLDYSSCEDKDKAKASRIISYSKKNSWNNEKEINRQINLDEEVVEMEYEHPFLLIYLKKVCENKEREKAKLIKFNTGKDEIEEVKIIDNYERIKNEERRQKEAEILELIARIEKIKGEPARKEILFKIGDELLFNILPTFKREHLDENELKQFNEELMENKEANIFWEDLKNKERNFLKTYNLSDRYFVPLECNRFNTKGNYIYLRTNEEGGMDGSDRHLIVRYRKDRKAITLLKDINFAGEIGANDFILLDPFMCNDEYYLIFTSQGVFNYDFEKQEKIFLDKHNFKGFPEFGDLNQVYFSDNTKKYFLTSDYQLGMFDINDLRYQYLSLENEEEIGIDFRTTDLELKEVQGNKLYFTSGEAPGYLFIYDKELKKWNKFWIPKETRGTIYEVKVFKDLVWIITNEGIFNNIIYVMDEDVKDSIRRIDINEGIITSSSRIYKYGGVTLNSKIFKTRNKLFIVGENGLWIFE